MVVFEGENPCEKICFASPKAGYSAIGTALAGVFQGASAGIDITFSGKPQCPGVRREYGKTVPRHKIDINRRSRMVSDA
jgi:hypothetical protein